MNKNTHIVVAKRYSEENGSYGYASLGTRPTLSSAIKLATDPANGSSHGDVILLLHIDGVSDPDHNAVVIYAVNSKGRIIEIRHEDYLELEYEPLCQIYSYYENLDGDGLIKKSYKDVGRNVAVKAVCECALFCIRQDYAGLTDREIKTYTQVISMAERNDVEFLRGKSQTVNAILHKYRKLDSRYGPYAVASGMRYLVNYVLGIGPFTGKDYSPEHVVIEMYDASTDFDTILKDMENIVKSVITPEVWMLGIAEKAK